MSITNRITAVFPHQDCQAGAAGLAASTVDPSLAPTPGALAEDACKSAVIRAPLISSTTGGADASPTRASSIRLLTTNTSNG